MNTEKLINTIHENAALPRVSLFEDFFMGLDDDSTFDECSSRIARLVDGENIVPDEDGIPGNFEFTKDGLDRAYSILSDYIPHNTLAKIIQRLSKGDKLAKDVRNLENRLENLKMSELLYACTTDKELRSVALMEVRKRLCK